MSFDNLDTDKGLAALNQHLADKSYVGGAGYTLSSEDFAVFDKAGKEPTAKFANVLRWYRHIASFSAEERTSAGAASGAAPAAAADDEDFDDDLFGSDDEFDEEYEKEVQRRADEAIAKRAAERAAKGAVVIPRSSVVMDVKIEDSDTDMAKLEEAVRAIVIDGLVWKAAEVIPIGFGISKLRICAYIEDNKVRCVLCVIVGVFV
jgi:elongation factor 1-beta